jgi:hypothetical protein
MKRFLTILMLSLSMTVLAQDRSGIPIPSPGSVTLPLDEYNTLIELAAKPEIKPESAPIPYAIKRASLKLRVENESVFGTVQCDGELFQKGISKIPLMNTPAILSARQTDKVLPLMQENGTHTAILSGPGEFSITLDAGMPLNIESGRASFNLPVPAAGSVQLSLELQGEHTNVKINPGLITRRVTENNKTVVEATLVPDQTANIWWTTREIAAPAAPREVRFLSDVKTLVSISEADMRLAALANISVIQGEPAQFEVEIPPGFEMTGVTGATLESENLQANRLILKINGTEKKYHQFLISLEKPISAAKADVPFLSFKGTQRETGEVLIEGEGTMELSATEGGTLKRMDLKEVNAYLRSLARHSLHAAFRYHRHPSEPPSLALTWNRFPDSSVLAAGAELADVTTLITSEGRSLTEVKLSVKNQAQPFLKLGLPSGASIVTAEVAGQTVKPVQGSDGTTRVPLLRAGFRPEGIYQVSFVIMHAGTPFAKKGESELSIPKMDIPISVLKWEVFLPERYKVKKFEGDAIEASLLPPELATPISVGFGSFSPTVAAIGGGNLTDLATFSGTVRDPAQAVIKGAIVALKNKATNNEIFRATNVSGRYVFRDIQPGYYTLTVEMDGFKRWEKNLFIGAASQDVLNIQLSIKALEDQVAVVAASELQQEAFSVGPSTIQEVLPEYLQDLPILKNNRIDQVHVLGGIGQLPGGSAEYGRGGAQGRNAPASANVLNLQRRVAGVLPIRVDVPRAGTSYSFIRPLVLDEETKVTFRYKRK